MNKTTSAKDRGIRNMPEDTKMFNNNREGKKSRNGSKSIYEGLDYNDEFLQPKNYFWSREHNVFPFAGHYKGASAFLCLSGPSFKTILDNHKDKLDRLFTMSTNNSVKSYRTDMWVSVDDPSRFLRSCWLDPKITKFVPIGHSEKKIWDSYTNTPMDIKTGECPNTYYFKRNNKFVASRWLTEASLNWGNHEDHGGGRSVLLPAIKILYILGFRKIFLLGCDFHMDANTKYHFEEERTKGAIKCNLNTYNRMKEEYFPALKPYFDKAGLEVYNCNRLSKLETFPFIDFEEAFNIATEGIGNTDEEPTLGMYVSPDKKKEQYKKKKDTGKEIKELYKKSQLEKDKTKKAETIDYVTYNAKKGDYWKHYKDGNKELIKENEYHDLVKRGIQNGRLPNG